MQQRTWELQERTRRFAAAVDVMCDHLPADPSAQRTAKKLRAAAKGVVVGYKDVCASPSPEKFISGISVVTSRSRGRVTCCSKRARWKRFSEGRAKRRRNGTGPDSLSLHKNNYVYEPSLITCWPGQRIRASSARPAISERTGERMDSRRNPESTPIGVSSKDPPEAPESAWGVPRSEGPHASTGGSPEADLSGVRRGFRSEPSARIRERRRRLSTEDCARSAASESTPAACRR
jgi:hypothetical protein